MQVDKGHWKYPRNFDPENWVGFIYRIIDLDTNREYIGKKFFFSTARKIVKGKKNRKKVVVDSNWREYTGSSIELNEAIALRGKDHFEFLIESLHETKGSLTFAEVEKQVYEDVLRTRLKCGTKKYYNKIIAPVKFMPADPTEQEMQARISHLVREHYPNGLFLWEEGMTDEDKQQYKEKYRLGTNNSTRRGKTEEEYQQWLDEHYRGVNNPMFGKKGKLSPRFGKKHTKEIREHLSLLNKGKMAGNKNPRYGKHPHENLSEDQILELKANLSKKMSGKNNPMYGKDPTAKMTADQKEAWRQKIIATSTGKTKSSETKARMKQGMKGVKKSVVKCPYCEKEGGSNNMYRYHFDNCKHKKDI